MQFIYFVLTIRYYICPEELNFKMPHFTNITLVIIIMANAAAFFHGLDGSKQNWDIVQHCMILVCAVYMFNVTVCLYFAYKANEKSEDSWRFVWDQLLHWHEAFVISAMWTVARAEARYYETVGLLERTNAEYNSLPRVKKYTRRSEKEKTGKNEDEESEQSAVIRLKLLVEFIGALLVSCILLAVLFFTILASRI
uniref:Uncharacterized protein n=3 Tax=Caenorhabditis japonica TaxID=281687 RepID=A0A8R1EBT7_CAEJA